MELSASEALRLSVEDVGQKTLIFIKDREDQTDEVMGRIQAHLRNLVQQRAEKAQADERDERLRGLPSRQPFRSTSCTPVYDSEEDREENLREEKEAYDRLIAEGGRPSHPISLGFDVLDNPGPYKDILLFWRFTYPDFQHEFRKQLQTWREFRKHQETVRRYYVPLKRFHEYEEKIQESQEDLQYKWDLTLQQDQHKQNRLEDWNEFRAFYYRRLKAQRKRIEPKEKEFLRINKELEDIAPELGCPYPEPDDHPMADVLDGERRERYADSKIEAAERMLEQARSSGQTTSIEEAEQKLHLAKKIRSETDSLSIAKQAFGHQQQHLWKWTLFLKWIDDQFPAIAAECGYEAHGAPPPPLSRTNRFLTRQIPHAVSGHSRRTQTRSALRPNSSSRISKSSGSKPDRRHTPQPLRPDTPPATTVPAHPLECQISPRRSERLRRLRSGRPNRSSEIANLGPVHSSKVAKTKRPTSNNVRPRPTNRSAVERKSTPPGCPAGVRLKDGIASSMNCNLRRSKRIQAQVSRPKSISIPTHNLLQAQGTTA